MKVSGQAPPRNSRKLPRIGTPEGPGGYRFLGSSTARMMRSSGMATSNPGVEIGIMVGSENTGKVLARVYMYLRESDNGMGM